MDLTTVRVGEDDDRTRDLFLMVAAFCQRPGEAEYRDVQLDFTPEIKVFHMMYEGCHTKNRTISLKLHINYFNFGSKIELDHPLQDGQGEAARGAADQTAGEWGDRRTISGIYVDI